jgi:uncharacterized protein YlzI (FlbEa/FlbD family)
MFDAVVVVVVGGVVVVEEDDDDVVDFVDLFQNKKFNITFF